MEELPELLQFIALGFRIACTRLPSVAAAVLPMFPISADAASQ
jgi:hypothetical protein